MKKEYFVVEGWQIMIGSILFGILSLLFYGLYLAIIKPIVLVEGWTTTIIAILVGVLLAGLIVLFLETKFRIPKFWSKKK